MRQGNQRESDPCLGLARWVWSLVFAQIAFAAKYPPPSALDGPSWAVGLLGLGLIILVHCRILVTAVSLVNSA